MKRDWWIPPIPLALGILFSVASWVLVFVYAFAPSFGIELAWIHAVALGSFTTIALSILIHVIPGFTDLPWRAKSFARASATLLPLTAAGLVGSFASGLLPGVAIFGAATALLVLLYTGAALATLVQRASSRAEAAIARALAMVLLFLVVAASLGAMLAAGYGFEKPQLLRFAPAHAVVGIVGWLTLLTMGVSARTFRPILGTMPRWRALHIFASAAMTLCALIASSASILGYPLVMRSAFVIGAAGALLYAVESFDRVLRATTKFLPGRALVAASLAWLLCACVAATLGAYDLAVIAALAGWLGQMINAHLHHLGIRLLATAIGGEQNETPPWQLLDLPLGWATAILAQLAVIGLVLGLVYADSRWYLIGASAGLFSWCAFALNAALAARAVSKQAGIFVR